MKSVSVERPEWPRFAAAFSREHDEWVATLQVREHDGSVETTLQELPFHGIAFETRPGHEVALLIFGDAADEHVTHLIEHPRAVIAAEAYDGSAASVTVIDAAGEACMLTLLNPMREETEVWA